VAAYNWIKAFGRQVESLKQEGATISKLKMDYLTKGRSGEFSKF